MTAEYVPASQALQLDILIPEKVPNGQEIQTVKYEDAENVPGEHRSQVQLSFAKPLLYPYSPALQTLRQSFSLILPSADVLYPS